MAEFLTALTGQAKGKLRITGGGLKALQRRPKPIAASPKLADLPI